MKDGEDKFFNAVIYFCTKFVPGWFKFLSWLIAIGALQILYKKTGDLFLLMIICISLLLLVFYFWSKILYVGTIKISTFKSEVVALIAFGFLVFGMLVLIEISILKIINHF